MNSTGFNPLFIGACRSSVDRNVEVDRFRKQK
jgi:hypothetical protein